MTDNMGQLILMGVILCIGIYLVWGYVLHGAGDSIASVQKCSSYSLGNGVCKTACEDTEQPFEGLGCTGEKNICCISKEPKGAQTT